MAKEVTCNTYLDHDGNPIEIKVTAGIICPNGHPEVENPNDPVENWEFNIRAYRVEHSGSWWSECRKCRNEGNPHYWFNEDGLWG